MTDTNATETEDEKRAVAVSGTGAFVVTARLATVLLIPPPAGGATGVVGAAPPETVAEPETGAVEDPGVETVPAADVAAGEEAAE